MKLNEFPVGCTENGTTLYVDVAAATSQEAQAFIELNRPRLDIIHVGESLGEVKVPKPMIMRLRAS